MAFFNSIAPFVKLNPTSKAVLLSVLQKQMFPKGYVLVPFGTICQEVYYIEKGLARTFYLKEGKEVTEKFSAENSFACSIISHTTKKPDNRQIELLEPTVLWTLPYKALERLYDFHHDIERLGRYLITLELIAMHQRLSDLQFAPAHERYANFIQSHPSLLQRVPLGMISSYIGVTQETLSRIRAAQ